MHLRNEPQRLLVVTTVREIHLRCKDGTGIISIDIHGKRRQRQKIDAIPVFQRSQVGIAHGHADDIGHAGIVTRSGTHPQQVMIAPLNVKVVIVTERIHDDMSSRTAVINITHNVQGVNGQPLYQIAHSDYEIIGTFGRNDGTDDDIDISIFVRVNGRLVQQFLNDIGKIGRKSFPHFGTSIFGRNILAHLDQLVQRYQIPVVQLFFLLLDQL